MKANWHQLSLNVSSDHVLIASLSLILWSRQEQYMYQSIKHVTSCRQQVVLWRWVSIDIWIWSVRDCDRVKEVWGWLDNRRGVIINPSFLANNQILTPPYEVQSKIWHTIKNVITLKIQGVEIPEFKVHLMKALGAVRYTMCQTAKMATKSKMATL